LLLTAYVWIYDAFFWTVGPLMTEYFSSTNLGGLFLVVYTLPTLILGLFVGKINKMFGKKVTAQIACMLSSFLLCTFYFINDPSIILITVFFASCSMAFALPSLNATYSDFVSESNYEKQIQALQDFFTNIGYVIGPIFAGILSDMVGNTKSFGLLGVSGILIVIISIFITPKHITIKVK
ncbi:MAG: MFS transporter, partial [Candidatus Roizmanbacteria bacterium]